MTQREIQQQHRKSTSMDDITIAPGVERVPPAGQTQWKSCSLQRGMVPPTENTNPIYGTADNPNGTLVIRRKAAQKIQTTDDEDPYGRCLNMKLTSFTENANGAANGANPRDPRIIDLTHSTPSSASVSVASTPRQGSPVQQHLTTSSHQFNTLPVHAHTASNNGGVQMASLSQNNTLPARVNGHGLPPQSPRNSLAGPMGRHFKPFDHRRLNPMAEIQENAEENPYGAARNQTGQVLYATRENPNGHSRPNSAASNPPAGLIVQKSTHLPHMPSELRHTNYSSNHHPAAPAGAHDPRKLMNPQILDHQRDSANFSLTSSDSG